MPTTITPRTGAIHYDTFGNNGHPALLLIQGLAAHMLGWREEFCVRLAEAGFYVSAGGRGSFLNCRVTGSGGYGFHVIDGCRTTLKKCRTERCARGGYEFADAPDAAAGAGPVVEDCTSDESGGLTPPAARETAVQTDSLSTGLLGAIPGQRITEQEPLVRNVTRSIDGLERSFNAMLDISRLDAGTVEPNVQHFPLRDVFRRLHMQYAGQAESAGLGICVDLFHCWTEAHLGSLLDRALLPDYHPDDARGNLLPPVEGASEATVRLALPKFRIETNVDILPALAVLGVQRTGYDAICKDMHVGCAIQCNVFVASETGGEVGKFEVPALKVEGEPPEIACDRPFAFIVRTVDRLTLLAGVFAGR
jgi:hypothetical protein